MSMSEGQATPPPSPIGIADANLPADGGLSGLGLIMSLTGALFLIMALGMGTLMMFTMMLAGGNLRGAGTILLIALAVITTSSLRSWAHRAAGLRLLYDGPGTPRSAVQRYYLLSAVQTLVILVCMGSQGIPSKILGLVAVMLVGWPVALAIALASDRYRALLDQQTIPQGEDKGFEGASILMVVLGLTGLLFGIVMAISTFQQISGIMRHESFLGFSLIAIVTMLIIRSSFHVRAGFRGVLEVHRDRAVESVAKYSNSAVLAGAVICGLFFLILLTSSGGHVDGAAILVSLVTLVFLMWGLSAWPLLVKRFFVERQFADLLVTQEATHARAPDRGLTTLGWLLFGQAVMALSMTLPALLASPMDPDNYERARDPISQMFSMFQMAGRAQWWSIGAAALQLVASWQLMRMRPNHKTLVTIWSVAAALIAVYINYPMLKMMSRGGLDGVFRGGEALLSNLSFMSVAISLIAPIATLVLVNRKQRELPTAVLHR